MKSYLSYFGKSSNSSICQINKLLYILKKKNIIYSFENNFICLFFKSLYDDKFIIYHNNFIPEYVVVETENIVMLKFCEDINLEIDKYNGIDDVILVLFSQITKVNSMKATENNFEKKNFNTFVKLLEEQKNKFILNVNNKKSQIPKFSKSYNESNVKINLFSTKVCVEMYGDQLIKLYENNHIDVLLDNFPNVKIFMGNFDFDNVKLNSHTHTHTHTHTYTHTNSLTHNPLVVSIDMTVDLNEGMMQPPKIHLSSNKILKDNILQVICKLKPFADVNSWSIKYSIYDSVINIYNMINTYGEIKQEFLTELDEIINDLEYLLRIQNHNVSETKLLEIFDKELILNNIPKPMKLSKSNDKWKKGTGYGHNGSKEWDIDSYVNNINEKKNNINNKFSLFANLLTEKYSNFKLIDSSILEQIVNLLIAYVENGIEHINVVLSIINLIHKNIEILTHIKNFSKLVNLLKSWTEDNDIKHEMFNSDNKEVNMLLITKIKSNDPFINMFEQYIWNDYNEPFNAFYSFDQTKHKKLKNIKPEQIIRIKKEFGIIKKSITINSIASIFFCVEKNNLSKMRFIISGPEKTPYSQGLYIFDMTLSDNFPSTPPLVHFSNNGRKRFNPNLYDCGKVCLSLLGTWEGDKGETWNSSTSSLFQVLVSIQSQILIDEPYFNEPGYETQIGHSNGIFRSKEYNDKIKKYNLDHAINDLIENVIDSKSPYQEFEPIIRNYFKFKKNKIIDMLNEWENEYTELTQKNAFKLSKEKFINLTAKL